MRALGLDLGSKRIGVALSTSDGVLATPYDTVHRTGDRAVEHARIAALAAEAEAGVLVVGVPYHLDGRISPNTAAALAEAEELRVTTGLVVDTYDERLTTVTAQRSLQDMKLNPAARRRVIDQVAATVMLQAWLDHRRANPPDEDPVSDDGEYDEYDDGYYDDGDYGEYEELPRRSRRGSPMAVTAVAVFAVLAILVAVTLVWASRQMNPSGEPGAKVASIVIPSGASFDDVATILEDEEVISSARVMGWYAKFNDIDPVKAGNYVDFRKNSSMSDAVDVLNAGPVPPKDQVLRIIPGTWLEDALEAIHKAFPNITVDQLKLTLLSGQVKSKIHADPNASWEGYLLPETYQFGEDATAAQILQRVVDEFDATLDELGYDKAEATTGHTAAELVTIASMVERETGDPVEERPKIARVIYNRLDKGTPTGVDATILYGLGRRGNEKPLTKSELETDGPYNSRTRPGPPPTAIALPSATSLDAAIHPANGDWIYYVLKTQSPRTHVFANTYKEFQAAKAECQANGFC